MTAECDGASAYCHDVLRDQLEGCLLVAVAADSVQQCRGHFFIDCFIGVCSAFCVVSPSVSVIALLPCRHLLFIL